MKKIIIIVLSLNTVLLFAQVMLSTFRSSGGVELATIRIQSESLREENNQIQSLIIEKSSLSYIESQAIAQGMKQIKTVTLLPLTVAQANKSEQP